MERRNLWPIFDANIEVMPKTLLKEQAEYLEENTHKMVLGEVVSGETVSAFGETFLRIVPDKFKKGPTLNENPLRHTFYIIAPKLNNYRFELLRVTHYRLHTYPLELFDSINEEKYELNNQDDFIKKLEYIFKSETVIDIIKSLIAQSIS
ncbi:hypothetical protein [Bacteroides thetaiotaomicron]|jgi:hypothetical protein|uniref:hypothetical protein n=1 Tax=Bacteroides thetaiotaomicron TaxID=818 RepID=UPI0008CA7C46|nr:hypothetical protein [Bacteroides thetaiotaomicron]MCS3183449.1 hypothetical protein [Bacteroides thetaiotaomicron]SEK35766.1 hypothetical protein SAMN02910322_00373 [Bacteroides thetaiotaomicron]DAL67331.1 MAG TPA: hypothetical protein [Caudoviricetes sp.]